jgi:hypothetical protein
MVVTKTELPENTYELSFKEFNYIVCRDQRIPMMEHTEGGITLEKNQTDRKDYVGAKLWHPRAIIKEARGIALVPRTAGDTAFRDVYAYAFQGIDEDGTIFSGLFGYGDKGDKTGFPVAVGPGDSVHRICGHMDDFLEKARLPHLDLQPDEIGSFQENHGKAMEIIRNQRLMEQKSWIYPALLIAGAGQKLVEINVVILE